MPYLAKCAEFEYSIADTVSSQFQEVLCTFLCNANTYCYIRLETLLGASPSVSPVDFPR